MTYINRLITTKQYPLSNEIALVIGKESYFITLEGDIPL